MGPVLTSQEQAHSRFLERANNARKVICSRTEVSISYPALWEILIAFRRGNRYSNSVNNTGTSIFKVIVFKLFIEKGFYYQFKLKNETPTRATTEV